MTISNDILSNLMFNTNRHVNSRTVINTNYWNVYFSSPPLISIFAIFSRNHLVVRNKYELVSKVLWPRRFIWNIWFSKCWRNVYPRSRHSVNFTLLRQHPCTRETSTFVYYCHCRMANCNSELSKKIFYTEAWAICQLSISLRRVNLFPGSLLVVYFKLNILQIICVN